MFESLKKKLSRTSDKLEEEIIEEAKQEDNLQEEEGNKGSFFSWGRKKNDEEVDESKLVESGEDEVKNEPKKSHFWSRSKGDDSDEEESGGEEVDVETPVRLKKSLRSPIFGLEIKIKMTILKRIVKMNFPKKKVVKRKKKNPTSGLEIKIKMMILLKEKGDYSHLFVKKQSLKNM